MSKTPAQFFLLIFSLMISCDEEESSYAIEPHIAYKNVVFAEGPAAFQEDTVKVTFSYTDGDGDLGIDYSDAVYLAPPYNEYSFFQTNFAQLLELESSVKLTPSAFDGRYLIEVNNASLGKLVYPRTRKNSVYTNLLPAYNCADYVYSDFIIKETDLTVLDEFSEITGTQTIDGTSYTEFTDTLYLERNPNYNNIEVDFLIENASGAFEEFDFLGETCNSFDGRFPAIPFTKVGAFRAKVNSKEKGELTYAMSGRGFKFIFGAKKIKLRVTIKDRALHVSNTIETPAFQL
jgi:hypothetical protein